MRTFVWLVVDPDGDVLYETDQLKQALERRREHPGSSIERKYTYKYSNAR